MRMTLQMRQSHNISYTEVGIGRALVFVHGMPGSWQSWLPQLEAFSPQYRVIAIDLPGYGASKYRADLDTPAKVADLLLCFLDDVAKGETVHFVGLSLGGMIGMEYAARAGASLATLTLLDCSPRFGLDGSSYADAFVEQVAAPLREGVRLEDLSRSILQGLVGPQCPESAFRAALSAMLRTTPDGLVQAARLIGNHDASAKLGAISVPTLVMAGEADQATPLAYSELIAESMGNARLVTVPTAGHLSNIENPKFVNDQLAAFLSEA